MRHGRVVAVVAGVVILVVVAAAIVLIRLARDPVDLSRSPPTLFTTIPMDVGASFTLGSMAIPSDVPRPVTVSEVRVIHASGVQVLGAGLFDPATRPQGIGLILGWPPPGYEIVDPADEPIGWPGEIAVVVGLRTVEPRSGLRGVLVRWVDGTNTQGERVFDMAVLTCAPAACELRGDDETALLIELGLQR
jgi:hypothetical protein